MKEIYLGEIAHARSGDKGDGSNVGVIAASPEVYELLLKELSVERVKEHFKAICHGKVERFELPNLLALNFLLHDSLGGGGTESIITDAQGKTHAQAMLRLKLQVPDDFRVFWPMGPPPES